MKRTCDACGLTLRGPKGHGYVDGDRVVCGRRRIARYVMRDGKPATAWVGTPSCSPRSERRRRRRKRKPE